MTIEILSDTEHPPVRRIGDLTELIQLIKEDRLVNDNTFFRPGLQAMTVYRFGVWREGITPRLLRMPLSFLYRTMYLFIRNVYGIELPSTTVVGRRLRIAHQHAIVVHPKAVIGDDCMIRQGVSVGIARVSKAELDAQVAPVIGDRVEIGANATIIGAVTIGNDVAIGPNTVIVTNIPDNSIVVSPMPRVIPRPENVKTSERLS